MRDSLEQTRSEIKEMKEKLDTLAASLEENKEEGQSQKRLRNINTRLRLLEDL